MKETISDIFSWLGDILFYNFFYWLRTHTVDRYHIIDLRDPHNGYRWGWLDSDGKMLYANFKILVDFIEKEKAFESHVDWDGNEDDKAIKAELLDLYNWWKTGRAREIEKINTMRVPDFQFEPTENPLFSRLKPLEGKDRVDMDAYSAADDRFEADQDAKLTRLIALRRYMWT